MISLLLIIIFKNNGKKHILVLTQEDGIVKERKRAIATRFDLAQGSLSSGGEDKIENEQED